MEFTEDQILRYSRHHHPARGRGDGQEKAAEREGGAWGAGGLGSPVGYYLAAAGVGTIGVIDNDRVRCRTSSARSRTTRKGSRVLKADSAKETYETLNHDVTVVTHKERLTSATIKEHHTRITTSWWTGQRQFSDAVSRERRLRHSEENADQRRGVPVRGAVNVHLSGRRAVLPLPL